MNIGGMLKTVATGIVSSFPGGSAVLGLVNAFLPNDKQLPIDATGLQVESAYKLLPPADQVRIASKEIDLGVTQEEEFSKRMSAMSKADGQSTRPKIAYIMARVLFIEIVLFSIVMVYAIVDGKSELIRSLEDLWMLFGVLTGTPATILVHYFGVLRKEQHARVGQKSGIMGVIAQFRGNK